MEFEREVWEKYLTCKQKTKVKTLINIKYDSYFYEYRGNYNEPFDKDKVFLSDFINGELKYIHPQSVVEVFQSYKRIKDWFCPTDKMIDWFSDNICFVKLVDGDIIPVLGNIKWINSLIFDDNIENVFNFKKED